eukprot:TRINITY_DN1238_c0_g2_i3.p1 TRINITY_DN1238_c0_g2~~TRINITY_DN1238_c0_g2_i3.p1  ORF type:complete len:168 (+),score=5.42 TRINITY_DN1238_c0_g2_i3:332-835(+)
MDTRFKRLERMTGGIMKVFVIFKPITFIFGIVLLLATLLIMLSIIMTITDKIMQDYCGSKCGFFLQYGAKLFNPLDQLLVIVSRFFPFDFVIMAFIVVYIFLCTMNGITRIGIRLLFFKLFSFRIRGTSPQGLLFAAWLLMLCVLALNNQVITLAPTYATFGSQRQV